jgi:hypothetical protein
MRKIVFDIETKNIFQDVGSRNPEDLDISVVGLYDSESRDFFSFTEGEFSQMWPYFLNADLLITYNGFYFDIPLLNKYFKKAGHGDLSKFRHVDLFKEVKQTSGRWLKLEKIAEGTFGIHKSGSGLDAIVWWRNGEIEKIKKYCIDDVKITRDIYDFALKNKKIMYKDGPFVKEVKLDVKHWEPLDEVKTQSLF